MQQATYTRADPKSIRWVIYDLDGLLLDTEPFYTRATQILVSRHGKEFDWSLKARTIGRSALDSAAILTRELGLPMTPAEYLDARRPILETLFPEAEPLPGAVRLTRHLHRHGVSQAVATSSNGGHFRLKTQRHREWFAIFDCCVTGDDPEIRQGKPAPDIFLAAARRLGADPRRCLVLEDSPAGLEAARHAGMSVVVVPDPNLDRSSLQGADQILESLEDFDPADWGMPPFDAGQGTR